MAEYIESNKMADVIHRYFLGYRVEDMIQDIRREAAADVSPVVHGKWEKNAHVWDEIPSSYCSCCGQGIADECIPWLKYCPNCGARMDGE